MTKPKTITQKEVKEPKAKESKKRPLCGPPWAPKSVPPPKRVGEPEKNPLDECLSSLKSHNGGKMSDAHADFIGAALASKKTADTAKDGDGKTESVVGSPALDKVVGPPWASKDYKQPTPETIDKSASLTEGYVPKKG